jgi:MFS transporter, OFA family, oxalate/formate antiporter
VWFFLTDTPQERGLVPLGQGNPSDGSARVEGESGQEPGDWTLREALYTPTLWLLGVAFCLGLMAAAAINAHQVAFLQDVGLTLEVASTIAGVTLGMSMGGRFAVGWASEHARHLHPILALCLVMQAAGIGLLLCLSVLGLWVLALFIPLFGLGFGGLVVLWPLTVGHDFGLRSFGAIAGVVGTVALSLGGALGPVVAGVTYDHTGSYQWAFLFCIGVLLVGAGAAFVTREPRVAHTVITASYMAGQGRENPLR